MSADNRLIIHHVDDKWYVWEGSSSIDYHSPIKTSKIFTSEEDATTYAFDEEDNHFVEDGVQFLNDAEIIRALRSELRDCMGMLNS